MHRHHRHRTPLVHTSKKRVDDVRSDINVTPLVDVCLVLLIIFMVVADKLTRGKEVALPKTRHHTEKKDNSDDPIISLSKDGAGMRFWWDRDSLKDMDALKKKLDDELHRKARPIYLKADADLTYGDVYPVLMAVHEAGAPGVQLSTAEIKEPQ